MDDTVQWPGQPLPFALDAARELDQHGPGREFYHPLQARLSGTTRSELTLLARLAGHGDWLADDMLCALIKSQDENVQRHADRERVLLELQPSCMSSSNTVAFGSWLRQFGSTAHNASHFWQQQQPHDHRVQAMLARLAAKPRAAPCREDLAQMSSDVARDLLVIAGDGNELLHQARVRQPSNPGGASDLFYCAGLAFLNADDGDSAAECLASAAALGHECAARTFLQQRSAHSRDKARLQELVGRCARPAQELILALAQCLMREGPGPARAAAKELLLGGNDPPDVRVFGTALVTMGFWTEEMLESEMYSFQALLDKLCQNAISL